MKVNSFKDILGDEYKEDLTPEQLEKLVCGKYADVETERDKAQNLVEKRNAEIGQLKDQARASLTEDEKSQADTKAKIEGYEARIKELERDASISSYTSEFIAQGYDDKLAKETAVAFVDGDTKTFFANQRKFNTAQQKTYEAQEIQGTPVPDAGQPGNVITKESFKKLSPDERQQLFDTNPQLFNELSSN